MVDPHHIKPEFNNCFNFHLKYFYVQKSLRPPRLSSKLWPISRHGFRMYSDTEQYVFLILALLPFIFSQKFCYFIFGKLAIVLVQS